MNSCKGNICALWQSESGHNLDLQSISSKGKELHYLIWTDDFYLVLGPTDRYCENVDVFNFGVIQRITRSTGALVKKYWL